MRTSVSCSLFDQKRRIFAFGVLAAVVVFGFMKSYPTTKPAVVKARKVIDARKHVPSFQKLKVNLESPLVTQISTLRPHASFSLEPWSVNISRIGAELFHDGAIAHTWTSIAIVKSGVQNGERRNAIRETFGAIKFMDGVRFETVFIIGKTEDGDAQKALEAENKAHGDLLQTDIPDTTKNLPLKITAGMWWVSQNVPGDWLYSSADDDMVLHPPNFARYVESLALDGRATDSVRMERIPMICIYGYQKEGKPDRNRRSKWYMSEALYPDPYWPPYCRGGWYSMPVRTAANIYDVSRTTPTLYLDDVWLTGIVRLKMYNQRNEHFQTGTLLKEQGIVGAPLADRTDKDFYYRRYEDDLSKVIVSHTWGNYGWLSTDVVTEIRSTWKKWKQSVWDRIRDVVS